MPLFRYVFLNEKEKKQKSYLYEKSLSQARSKLLTHKIRLVHIESCSKNQEKKLFSEKTLLYFLFHLHTLLNSSLPLFDSLEILEEQCRHESAFPLISSLKEKILSGHSLSHALKLFPNTFSEDLIAIIQAGEASGDLPSSILSAYLHLKSLNSLKKKFIHAISYPLFLLLFCTLLIFLLLLFVIPSLENLLDFQQANLWTSLVLQASFLLRSYGLPIVFFASSITAAMLYAIKRKWLVVSFSSFLHNLPFLKRHFYNTYLLRFSRQMHTLLSHNIPLTEALSLAKNALPPEKMKREFSLLQERVFEGAPFSSELEKISFLPSFFTKMVHVGERSGNLSKVFLGITQVLEQEAEHTLSLLERYGQPIIITIMGIIVGAIMLAVLLPLTDMSSLNF